MLGFMLQRHSDPTSPQLLSLRKNTQVLLAHLSCPSPPYSKFPASGLTLYTLVSKMVCLISMPCPYKTGWALSYRRSTMGILQNYHPAATNSADSPSPHSTDWKRLQQQLFLSESSSHPPDFFTMLPSAWRLSLSPVHTT